VEKILSEVSLVQPKTFGLDPIAIELGHINDARWMKHRYGGKVRFQREMLFVFSHTVMVNLTNEHKTPKAGQPIPTFMDQVLEITLSEEHKYKIKTRDNRYKNIDKRKIIESLQNPRAIGS
jgi:hypothetical protein